MCMNYTVKINEVNNKESNVKAFATVVFGDSFKICNIAVVKNKEGNLFVSMPSYKSNERTEQNEALFKDICNPITAAFQKEFSQAILSAYDRRNELGKNGMFASMTSYKTNQQINGKPVYQDICFPVTKEFREQSPADNRLEGSNMDGKVVKELLNDENVRELLELLQKYKQREQAEEIVQSVEYVQQLENILAGMMEQLTKMKAELDDMRVQNQYLVRKADWTVRDTLVSNVEKMEVRVQELHKKLDHAKE